MPCWVLGTPEGTVRPVPALVPLYGDPLPDGWQYRKPKASLGAAHGKGSRMGRGLARVSASVPGLAQTSHGDLFGDRGGESGSRLLYLQRVPRACLAWP